MKKQNKKIQDADLQFVKKKMIRLLVVSSLVMIVGLLAVFFAIVYKVDTSIDIFAGNKNSAATSGIKLEAGANILETSIAGENLILRIQDSQGQHKILIYKNNLLSQTILIVR